MKTKLEITLNENDIKKAIRNYVRENHQTEVSAQQIEFKKNYSYSDATAIIIVETDDEKPVFTVPDTDGDENGPRETLP